MRTITIRGIRPEVDEKLKKAAREQGKSTNQLVLEMIRKDLGIEKERKYSREYNDLYHLFGSWSEEEYKNITEKLKR
ncbi:MAG: antitoxin, partial [Spirochaetota bacterium]